MGQVATEVQIKLAYRIKDCWLRAARILCLDCLQCCSGACELACLLGWKLSLPGQAFLHVISKTGTSHRTH